MRKLVAYFSATGVTANVANRLADAIGADVFEIQPTQVYTKEDFFVGTGIPKFHRNKRAYLQTGNSETPG